MQLRAFLGKPVLVIENLPFREIALYEDADLRSIESHGSLPVTLSLLPD
jgi:hypothetical protein